ncbi:MAG: 4-hydroxy-tetrahydrodipicolinate reductase [Paludibacteraceae bacterium]|nr:4-hydroxy-tetrahydrodipicolinate reductase [Paludibacteraceae bacterium]MBQ8705199.1 4-hydroxy-tetrahydrodipicolinate reductase [Paludibacteraceae bacterium]
MKIAIIGYGKMGHMIEEVALSRGHQIVGVIDPRLNEELKIKNEELSLPLIDFESKEFRSADVAIEFTTPATAEDNIRKAWAQGVPVVCGTTGWDAATLMDEDRRTHDKQMLVWSSNFSVGVNIFFELNKFLAQKMAEQPQYTPSIKEIHHIHKLDKPSGTAKTLAEQISAMYEGRMYDVRREVPIESIREGEVPGTHEVTWDSEEDTIVITHIAKGRRGFALGAVLAAEEVTR